MSKSLMSGRTVSTSNFGKDDDIFRRVKKIEESMKNLERYANELESKNRSLALRVSALERE